MNADKMYAMLCEKFDKNEQRLKALEEIGYIELKPITVNQIFKEDYFIGDDFNDDLQYVCKEIAHDVKDEEFEQAINELEEE